MSEIVVQYYPGHFPPVRSNVGPYHAAIGAGLLLAMSGSKVIFRGEAWGGPSAIIPVANGPAMTPTPAGTYRLFTPEPYKTTTYWTSQIRWGTPIKNSPVDPNDVWYLSSISQGKENWSSFKKDFKVNRELIMATFSEIFGQPLTALPKLWLLNDFGPLAVRFYRDLNNNGVLDRREKLEGAMFHTTPDDERSTEVGIEPNLTVSHGCIHLRPKDRDTLIGLKAFKAGNKLVIHDYNERYGTSL